MNQGTVRDPSAKAKTPLSYQETDEDEKTARNRAILTAELKEKQTRQRAEDERLRLLQQPQGKDKIRKIAEAREDQQRIKKKRKEEDPRRRNYRWEDEDRVVRKESSESSKTALSNKNSVIMHLMYPDHRSAMRVII